MYIITSMVYTGGPTFKTLGEARKALSEYKKEDKASCKRRFGRASVNNWTDGYCIEFGCNIWSARNIRKA